MKKRKPKDYDEIVLGTDIMKCSKCLHVRENEPFLKQGRYLSSGGVAFYYTCWHCCRDAESTLLIWQKWPLAFERFQQVGAWILIWDKRIQAFLGESNEA